MVRRGGKERAQPFAFCVLCLSTSPRGLKLDPSISFKRDDLTVVNSRFKHGHLLNAYGRTFLPDARYRKLLNCRELFVNCRNKKSEDTGNRHLQG